MISVAEAETIILNHAPLLPADKVPLEQATGRILREPLVADRSSPPFDRVCMDGIAIRYADYDAGMRSFVLQGIQKAGEQPLTLDAGRAIEIMTGAVLPEGADTIIQVEQLNVQNNTATLQQDTKVKAGQNIHIMGSDHQAGAILLSAGVRMTAPRIAIAASVGMAEIAVTRQVKAAVLATGDELVPVSATPQPWQIRRSNSHAIAASLVQAGCAIIQHEHIVDDLAALQSAMERALAGADLVVISGGISAGKFDFVEQALAASGVTRHLYKVAQRPGKPMAFGTKGQTALFALPGNPVSAVACLHRYVVPWLAKVTGDNAAQQPMHAKLMEPFRFGKKLTFFLPVAAVSHQDNASLYAMPLPTNGSGDWATIGKATGIVEIPAEYDDVSKGKTLRYFPYL